MDTEVRDLYPFASHYLDLDGLRYHYVDEGSGPAVVMLHGNPSWSFYYHELIRGLRDHYRVIVPDHLGCGLSDKPQRYPYRLQNHADNLERLLAHLALDRYSLVMHDWGGPIGLGAAVRDPQRVARLVFFNTTAFVTTHYPWRILACKLPVVGQLAIRGLNLFALGGIALGCCRRDRLTPAVKAGMLLPYDSYASRVANLRFIQDIPLRPAHPTWSLGKQIEDQLAGLTSVPTMICWGRRDFCFDDYFLQRLRALFPQATVHAYDDAGHYVVLDAGDRILPELQAFLGR